MHNKVRKTVLSVVLIALTLSHVFGFVSYAQLNGVNNNISPWRRRLNEALDSIGFKIIDGVIDDENDRKKYEGLEQWEIDKIKEEEAKKASLSNALKASISEIASKSSAK